MTPPASCEATRLPEQSARFLRCLSFEGGRRNNLDYIASRTLIHICGNSVQFLDLDTMCQTSLLSKGGEGIGCLAVHPSKGYFAVCEKGIHPNVYIYKYPSLEVHKILKMGTEKIYTAAAFNYDGSQLATVGGHPDYWLTVWDWMSETIVLQSKAFSQDVFKVSFSQHFPGQLLTAGIGHIRFWKMAKTFTGLKLEGMIGKFGQVPLSDISSYLELADGKVLSGTETGNIIVWDGGLIKCQLKRPGGLPCHDGMIEVLQMDENENEILTAGADGCVRFWSLEWLDAADDGDEKTICEINPLRELQVDEKCSIKGIIVADDHWLIQDEYGVLWKVHVPSFEAEKVLEFHSGSILGLSVSPNSLFLSTSGSDCSVRLFHFNENKQIYARWFTTGGTSILWPSKSVDLHCRTVITGFADGVVRVLSQEPSHWRLVNAQKPHTADVTSLKITPDGEVLATSSLDATVFFFHASNKYQPLGFIKAPGPVTCIDWSQSGQFLLLGCTNGKVLEVARPGYSIDTHMTYELNLPSKLYMFCLSEIRGLLQTTSNVDGDAQKSSEGSETTSSENLDLDSVNQGHENPEGEDSLDRREVESRTHSSEEDKLEINEIPSVSKNILEGELEESEDTSAATKDFSYGKQTDQVENRKLSKPINRNKLQDSAGTPGLTEQDQSVYAVRALIYTNSNLNTFYIALEGNAAGYIFECHIDMKGVMGVAKWHSGPSKSLGYSSSYQYIVSGHDDGVVHIQTAPTPGQLAVMQQHVYWEGRIHDGFNGMVSGAMISYNHQYLASVAYDGSFYVHELSFERDKLEGADVYVSELGSEKHVEDEADDISLKAYSIEEDKQKTEEDRKLRLALQKKEKVKHRVDQIRNSLAKILKENNARDANERLPLEEFEIDSNLRSMIEKEIQNNVDEVKRELQWETEKKSIALSKLRQCFLDPLEVERIVLHSFRTGLSVSTFRTLKIDKSTLDAIVEANAHKEPAPAPRVSVLTMIKDPQQIPDDQRILHEENEMEDKLPKDQDSTALQDMRRLHLKKSMAKYDEFVKKKESMNFESEDDVAAIRYAEANKGDFKLKSDLQHVRPIGQQTNARKKKNEMLLLKEAVHKQKMEFNQEFLYLREIKRQISKQILEKNKRIQDINSILRIKDEVLFVPSTFNDESPEEREIVTNKDIDDFCNRVKTLEEMQKKKKDIDFGGMDSKTKSDKDPHSKATIKRPSLYDADQSRKRDFDKTQKGTLAAQIKAFPLSNLEQEEQDGIQIKLKFEKAKLLEKIERMISTFDIALQELKHKRFQLEINIKRSDSKMITLYQELRLLKSMQPKEEAIESRHFAKLLELSELSGKVLEQDKLLEQKKQEVHALNEKKKQLMGEFEDLLGENHPAKDALLKIYVRKVKLSKAAEDEESDDLDEDFDAEDSKGSEEDFEEDEVVEVCPPGCEQDLYQKVSQLRERRTVEDTLLVESNKQLEALQREKESKLKKKKAAKTALAALEKEMEEFQKEKQNGLNQIDAVLTLYMHQIEYLVDGQLPDDLSGALVFSNIIINELKETIKEHGSETLALTKLQKELRKDHLSLIRDRKSRESKIADLEQRVIDVQMLKFGQVIDLEVLDTMNTKKEGEELRLQLKALETENAAEVSKWNKKIDDSIDAIARAMKENAACLNVIADIKESLLALDQAMKRKASSPYRDLLLEKKKAEAEHLHLCKVVAAQKQQIDNLKDELAAIKKERRKVFP